MRSSVQRLYALISVFSEIWFKITDLDYFVLSKLEITPYTLVAAYIVAKHLIRDIILIYIEQTVLCCPVMSPAYPLHPNKFIEYAHLVCKCKKTSSVCSRRTSVDLGVYM
jgi:hypothetical protein